MTQEEFLKMLWPHALAASQATGIDPRIIIAQSAIETGWGKHAPNNNYFGMKDFSGNGAQLATTEEINGKTVKMMQPFAKYDSPEASVAAYVNQMQTNPAFSKIGSAPGYGAQVAELGKSGYATSSAYPALVDKVATGLTVPTDVQPSLLPVGGRFINGPGAGANGQVAATTPTPVAPAPAEDDWRDMVGYGGSPKRLVAESPDADAKRVAGASSKLTGMGLGLLSAGEPQGSQTPAWMQQAMAGGGAGVHRPQMPAGLLSLIPDLEEEKRLRKRHQSQLNGLLGE